MPDLLPRRLGRLVRCVLLLALPLALALAGPLAPARADHVRHRDALHDVRRTRDGAPTSTPARKRAEPDVTVLKVAYNRHRLRVMARVRQLSRGRNHAMLVQIVTPHYTAGVYFTRIPRLHLRQALLLRGAGQTVDCPGLRVKTWFAKGVVNTLVPRPCLNDARWVRVGFALSWTTRTQSFTDDGLSPRLGGAATLTPRLRAT